MDPVFFVHLEERERGCLVKMDVLHCSMFISRIQTYSVPSINCDLGGPITAPALPPLAAGKKRNEGPKGVLFVMPFMGTGLGRGRGYLSTGLLFGPVKQVPYIKSGIMLVLLRKKHHSAGRLMRGPQIRINFAISSRESRPPVLSPSIRSIVRPEDQNPNCNFPPRRSRSIYLTVSVQF